MNESCILLILTKPGLAVSVSRKFENSAFDLHTMSSEASAIAYISSLDYKMSCLLVADADAGESNNVAIVKRLQSIADLPALYIVEEQNQNCSYLAESAGAYGFVHLDSPASHYITAALIAIRLHCALNQSLKCESRFRAIFECYPLAVSEVNLQGIILNWNPAAEKLFGWSKKEILGRYAPQVPEDVSPEYDLLRARVTRGESFVNREVWRQCKDGRLIRVFLSTAPVRDRAGSVRSIVAVFRSLSSGPSGSDSLIHHNNATIRNPGSPNEPDRLLGALFEAEKHLVLILNQDGIVKKAGAFLRSLLDKDVSYKIADLPWLESLVHPEDTQRAREFLSNIERLGSCESIISFLSSYGTRIVLELYGRRIGLYDGEEAILLIGSVSTAPEAFVPQSHPASMVTGRILAGLEEAVFVLGSDCSVIQECNLSAGMVFGLPSSKLIGRRLDELCPLGESFAEWASEELHRKGLARRDQRFIRSNGDVFPTQVQVIPILDRGGFVARSVATVKDLSFEHRQIAEKDSITARLKELAGSISELSERLGGTLKVKGLDLWGVTPRQLRIAQCLASGLSNKAIAYTLECSEMAVKQQVYGLYKKTGTKSRMEFLRFLQDHGIEM